MGQRTSILLAEKTLGRGVSFVNKYLSFQEDNIVLVEEESCPIYDTDNEEEESMSVYDTDIEDVIEEEEGFVGKGGFGGEEDNIEDVVVMANDLCSSMIQTILSVDFEEDNNTKSHELMLFGKSIIIKVIKATNEFEVDGRIAWVEVEGVPFKLWTNNTFTRIAEKQVIVSEEDFKNHYRAGSLQVSEFHRTGGSMVGLLEDCDKKVGQIRIWNKSNSGTRKNDQLRLKKQLEEIDLDIDRGIGNEELVNSRLAILHQIQKGLDNLEIEGNGSKG
ncbi:hypothetical protein Tco_1274607 [Tanacetum coccineum]